MTAALRVLVVEDRDEDAELMLRELRRADLPHTARRAVTAAAFRRAFDEFEPEIVLADFNVPGFGGMDALGILRVERPLVPLVVVTGSLDEETAAACIKAGAADYVLKTNLARFCTAVPRPRACSATISPSSSGATPSSSSTPTTRRRSPSASARPWRAPRRASASWRAFRHKDGTWRHLEGILTNLLDVPSVGAIVNNYRDVTERRSLQEQFISGALFQKIREVLDRER
jgi:CheY-like chemotaxis protein